jgi:hypothetical protein
MIVGNWRYQMPAYAMATRMGLDPATGPLNDLSRRAKEDLGDAEVP